MWNVSLYFDSSGILAYVASSRENNQTIYGKLECLSCPLKCNLFEKICPWTDIGIFCYYRQIKLFLNIWKICPSKWYCDFCQSKTNKFTFIIFFFKCVLSQILKLLVFRTIIRSEKPINLSFKLKIYESLKQVNEV